MALVRSLGAAQTIPARGDVDTNVERHLELVRAVSNEGLHVLVFPELSLTGYELDLADDLAFAEHDRRLAPLAEAAAAFSIVLVVGAPVRIGNALHIGAFILHPNGALELHTKHELGAFSPEVSPDGIVPPPEHEIFVPGTIRPLLRFGGHAAAIGVCAESLKERHAADASRRGATTYLTSHFGIPLDGEFRAAILREHAVKHSMAVVFSNYGGPTGGLTAGGKSAIWSERGELLAQLGATGAGVVIARQSEEGWTAKTLVLDGNRAAETVSPIDITDSHSAGFSLRQARPGDESSLFELIVALARYEHLSHEVTGSAEMLGQHLFDERARVEAIVAESEGRIVGFALFFETYSTFLTRPGVYLEDLFVVESHRGRGIGRTLLTKVRELAVARGAGRLDWAVLDWNETAIRFYEGLGATILPDWRRCRIVLRS